MDSDDDEQQWNPVEFDSFRSFRSFGAAIRTRSGRTEPYHKHLWHEDHRGIAQGQHKSSTSPRMHVECPVPVYVPVRPINNARKRQVVKAMDALSGEQRVGMSTASNTGYATTWNTLPVVFVFAVLQGWRVPRRVTLRDADVSMAPRPSFANVRNPDSRPVLSLLLSSQCHPREVAQHFCRWSPNRSVIPKCHSEVHSAWYSPLHARCEGPGCAGALSLVLHRKRNMWCPCL